MTDDTTPELTVEERFAQIYARSQRLADVPLETSTSNYIMRDMIDSIGDVRWLLEQLQAARLDDARAVVDAIERRHVSGQGLIRRVRQINALFERFNRYIADAEQRTEDVYTADADQPEVRDHSAWCWNRHPDHPLPCGRLAGHYGQHARGERRWDSVEQPEDGDRG